jgi:Sigma-70, region 4
MKTCLVEGCGKRQYARGLCSTHNYRLRVHGALRLPVRYPDARNKEIVAARRAGSTLAAIGKVHGLTRERVRQIVKREEWRQHEWES